MDIPITPVRDERSGHYVHPTGGGAFDVGHDGGGTFDVPPGDEGNVADDLHLDHGCDADLAKTEDEARKILLDHCPCGTEEEMEPVFTFTHYNGYLFQFGHEGNKCSWRKCLSQADPKLPSNCLFHDQWCFPTSFSYCGPNCKGGFCQCLDTYPSQDGNYI